MEYKDTKDIRHKTNDAKTKDANYFEDKKTILELHEIPE